MFHAFFDGSRSLFLEWSPPSPGTENGIIQNYVLIVNEQQTGMTSQYTPVDSHITIFSLHPYYTYVITVAAVTVVGTGPTNVLTIEMPEDGKES